MPINSFLYPGAKVTLGYDVDNSFMFESGDSAYLSKEYSSAASENKTFTVSTWVKRSKLGAVDSHQDVVSAYRSSDGLQTDVVRFQNTDQLQFYAHSTNSGTNAHLRTDRVFRDISAWYNIVVRVDTTQSTASNRIRIYVNGVQETSFSVETYPDQNGTIVWGLGSGTSHQIGAVGNSNHFSGYITETVYLDNQSVDPTSFGEFDSDSPTVWKPIDVSGLTYGGNSFYLDFETPGNVGLDSSGNSNNFDGNNLQQKDQAQDTCTNNFCTLNSLDNYYQDDTLSQGNTKMVGGSRHAHRIGTFGLSTGKWYFEVQTNNFQSSDQTGIGIAAEGPTSNDYETYNQSGSNVGYVYYSNGAVYGGGSTIQSSGTFSSGSGTHIIGVALNLTDSKIAWSYDGTWQGSTDPGAGNTNMTSITATSSLINGVYFPAVKQKANNRILNVNFGGAFNENFANTAETDANGYGHFEYSVPSGYYSINSKNLAEFG